MTTHSSISFFSIYTPLPYSSSLCWRLSSTANRNRNWQNLKENSLENYIKIIQFDMHIDTRNSSSKSVSYRWLAMGTWQVEVHYFLSGGSLFYNIVVVFAIYRHEWATGLHVSPHLEPPPISLPIPSLWVVPEHLLWVPCFMHQIYIGHLFTYGNIHDSLLFSQIFPPSPSPT